MISTLSPHPHPNFPQPFQLLSKDQVSRAMEGVDVVINLIGQDADSRHFGLEDVHETGAKNIAEAATALGIKRLIHVSALGANPDSPSRFLASKVGKGGERRRLTPLLNKLPSPLLQGRGELLVRDAYKDVDIVRPAAMFGHEDRLLNRMACKCPESTFMASTQPPFAPLPRSPGPNQARPDPFRRWPRQEAPRLRA